MAPDNTVLVTDETGSIVELIPLEAAGEDILTLKGILTPGFVNCHCHLELSHMQGKLPQNTGLVDFLLAVMSRRGPLSPDPATLEAIASAEEYMLDSGIVAVGDICNTPATIAQKSQGNLLYHNFIEAMGFSGPSAPDRFAQALQTFQAFAEAYTYPIETNSIVPHAPYSVSPELFKLIANFPGNRLLTIHNQEAEAENQFYLDGQGDFLRLYAALGLDTSFFKGTGKRSLPAILPHFYRNQSLILVHNVTTSEADLSLTGIHPSLFLCLCPNANLYISDTLPDVPALIRSGNTIVLGTDSLASNTRLDILQEMKTLQTHFPQLDNSTLLKWATANGASALQMENILGSFDTGKQPGIVLIENTGQDRLTPDSRSIRIL